MTDNKRIKECKRKVIAAINRVDFGERFERRA